MTVTGAVTVRPAAASELDEVGRLTVAAYRASGLIAEGTGYEVRLADAAGRAGDAELLVAVAGERILGSVTCCAHGNRHAEIARPGEVEFRMLAVAPEARGAGVAEALVGAVLECARRAGATAVVLSTPDNASAAHRLYARMGFARMPERDWKPVPQVQLQAYRFAL